MQIPILDANVIDYTEQGIANTSLIAHDPSVNPEHPLIFAGTSMHFTSCSSEDL